MLLYRQEFNLNSYPQELILIPLLFDQPQLVIQVAGFLSSGRDSNYAGKIQQQIMSSEINFRIRGEVLNVDFGYQLFASKFGKNYQLEFLPSTRLEKLELSIYELENLLPSLNVITY